MSEIKILLFNAILMPKIQLKIIKQSFLKLDKNIQD
jgi:hypothetical protein